MIYFDHAATSWPKPAEVKAAMSKCLDEYAVNPGRGAHRLSLKASKTVFECRALIAELFHIKNPVDIFFHPNTTSAINQGLMGILQKNDHVITTRIEHNSVRRPLEQLKKNNVITLDYISIGMNGEIDWDELDRKYQKNTRLLVVSHVSNLLGTILPIDDLGKWAKERHVMFMVDAAQSAGVLEIDVEKLNIDLLAFPGHKGLLGPQGTGGLYVKPDLEISPLIVGGTGSQSELINQPTVRPDGYESGTLNIIGIAGLCASLKWIKEKGIANIREHEKILTSYCLKRLEEIPNLKVYGSSVGEHRVAVIAFNIKGKTPHQIAYDLDKKYNIAIRSGFHCTPLTHESIGTMSQGAARISFGVDNSLEEIDVLITALKEIQFE